MRKSLLAALMAATALVPAAAYAQRSERTDGGAADAGERRQARMEARAEGRGGDQPRAEQARAEQPHPEQQRADRGNNGGESRGGWNRGNREVDQPAPQQQQQQPNGADRGRGDRGDNGQRGNNGGWRGDRGGGTAVGVNVGVQTPPVIRNDPGRRDNRGDSIQSDNRGNQRGNDGRGGDARGNPAQGRDWRGNDNRGGSDWRGNGNRIDSRYGNTRGNWNRDWRQDRRYDWSSRRQYNRNAYHLPRYYAPSGWNYGYRRFTIGFTLSATLFGENYWIDDPYYYGLPEAYGPYRWVRYYNDALLVDVYSGQVVDTVYDIFW